MRQSASLFTILLMCLTPALVAAQEPMEAAPGFAAYLKESRLYRLYLTELRNLCLGERELSACVEYAGLLNSRSKHDEAYAFADSLKCQDSRFDLTARLVRAGALFTATRFDDAVTLLDSLIALLPPKDLMLEAVLLRAKCQFRLGQVDDALINLRTIQPYVAGPRRADFLIWLGRCEEENGDLDEAKALYQEAWEGGSADGALGLLRCNLREGNVKDFLQLQDDIKDRGIGLPSESACELATEVGEVVPEIWPGLMEYAVQDTGFDLQRCPEMANSVVRFAEMGGDVGAYCDTLLSREFPREANQKLRYARAVASMESAWACDTLALLSRQVSDPDLKIRCFAACLEAGARGDGGCVSQDAVNEMLPLLADLDPDERYNLSELLASSGFREAAARQLNRMLGELRVGFDDAAISKIAFLLEQAGDTSAALAAYSKVSDSPLPSREGLICRKKTYLERRVRRSKPGIAQDVQRIAIAQEIERIATEGASDVELGDLFMDKLHDYERAAHYYQRAIDSSAEGVDVDKVKLKLVRSMLHGWFCGSIVGNAKELGGRRQALTQLSDLAQSESIDPHDIVEALELATDFLRLDHEEAIDVTRMLISRKDLNGEHLYEIARLLYQLFLQRDGNVYSECVLTLKRLLEEFPSSPQASIGALLLGRARFMAGDYVGALKAYESCIRKWQEPLVISLCNMGIGQCYLYSGGMAEAVSYLKRAGDSPDVAYNTARCYEIAGQGDSAEVYYRLSLLRYSPQTMATARLKLSLLLLEKDGLDTAMRELDSAVPEIRRQLSELRSAVRAYALGRSGYRDLGVRVLNDISKAPDDVISCESLLLASRLASVDDPNWGVSILEKGETRCKDIFGIFGLLHDRASYGCSSGPHERCWADVQTFKQRFPLDRNGDLEFGLGQIIFLFREGEADTAAAMLDSLLVSGRKHALISEALYQRGVSLLLKGDYPGAVQDFLMIQREYPDQDLDYRTWFKLGTCYYMMAKYDSSAMYFELASHSSEPSLVENALFNLGLALEENGDLAEAAQAFWTLAVRFPFSERFERSLMRSAYALERAGLQSKAIGIYKGLVQYVESSETAAEATYWVGESFSEKGDHLRAAVEFLRVGYLYPQEAEWAGTASYRAGMECEKAGLSDHAAIIYAQNVRRFGTGTSWGKASQERLTELQKEQ